MRIRKIRGIGSGSLGVGASLHNLLRETSKLESASDDTMPPTVTKDIKPNESLRVYACATGIVQLQHRNRSV